MMHYSVDCTRFYSVWVVVVISTCIAVKIKCVKDSKLQSFRNPNSIGRTGGKGVRRMNSRALTLLPGIFSLQKNLLMHPESVLSAFVSGKKSSVEFSDSTPLLVYFFSWYKTFRTLNADPPSFSRVCRIKLRHCIGSSPMSHTSIRNSPCTWN